jgi:P-type conjugative transfer protein TrbJ
MKNIIKNMQVLAAKVVVLVATTFGVLTSAHAGIPVIDGANLTQTVATAVENVAHTMKKIQQ